MGGVLTERAPARPDRTILHEACRRSRVAPTPGVLRDGASHGLQYLLLRHVGRQYRAPVGVARQYVEPGRQRVIARAHARRGAAVGDRLDRLAQQPAHLDDRLVGGPEMLAA